MPFSKLGLAPSLVYAARADGLQGTHAGPDRIHSSRAERSRPAGARPDGHRQDRRVRPADDRPPLRCERTRPQNAQPRGLVLVPTRELAVAGPRARSRRMARRFGSASTPIFGGVPMGPQMQGAEAGHRHRRGHAGPAHRSHAAAHDRSLGGRDPHAGRSRSDARHGLPAAASPRASGAAAHAPDAAVFGDAVDGGRPALRRVHARSAARRRLERATSWRRR